MRAPWQRGIPLGMHVGTFGEEIQQLTCTEHGSTRGFPPPPEGPFRYSLFFHGILERLDRKGP